MTNPTVSPPTLSVVSRDAHGHKRWRRHGDYKFAADQAAVPLVGLEAGRAAISMPIGFLKVGEAYSLVALLGLQAGRNLFVAPDGRWLSGYVPAVIRTYPFRMINDGSGGTILGVVEDERFIGEDIDGERFFEGDEGNTPSAALKAVVEMLQPMAPAAQATAAAAALLAKHGLLAPWEIPVAGREAPLVLAGVFKINEAALNILPAQALKAVRDGGALALAYAQLVSQQHIALLGSLAEAHAAVAARAAAAASQLVSPRGELDLEFLNRNEVLDFRGLT